MSGDFEGAGDLATGALLAHAVDRGAGAQAGAGHGICLNCGTGLIGAHCHHCGQAAHVHRSIGAIWHDLLHGVVHFEGRLWRTLPLLALRPGELMRRYIQGERARFVSPMAMFLFSVFALFAMLQFMGIQPPATVNLNDAQIAARLQGDIADARADRARLTARLESAEPAERAELQTRIADLAEREQGLAAALPVMERSTNLDSFKIGWARLDKGIAKVNENPGLMLYKLQTNSYKFSWLLIPLSIPFIWILFAWRPQFRAYDHAIFVTYSIAFMSLLFIALTIFGALGGSWALIALIGGLLPPFHMYRQLRGGYGLRRTTALLRMLVLIAFWIPTIATLFLMIVLGLGLLG